ncbi:hypothetical protein Herbaro_17150 [Herbaspirillum sp. WKF16]|uniref:hypothetical protein n=1 Tax=Herbaspirillum sp. WKF16 TaxID=3028312 RepID=UPI0023A91C5E|nr:hypothetical protein [Herbaspirillum sp. WKF16]WDZ95201.1 hypothetical protein Herbaro_17150 [Herbaspirillum sp. WKF16]
MATLGMRVYILELATPEISGRICRQILTSPPEIKPGKSLEPLFHCAAIGEYLKLRSHRSILAEQE